LKTKEKKALQIPEGGFPRSPNPKRRRLKVKIKRKDQDSNVWEHMGKKQRAEGGKKKRQRGERPRGKVKRYPNG